ncbi:tubulin epsilon chain [Syngnathoides biaculeatus]|uniref:tubulin epsilon chain n=1 Tax=Syngnathoides biaculeatus TaxID=300417 RepID=UPI002ADDF691|nr:tubulin epsilon chain [Syngnathoides biaculeatus]
MTQSVVVQVGQCGNQIGCRFWDLALQEYARFNKTGLYDDAAGTFFHAADSRSGDGVYCVQDGTIRQLKARAVLLDTEEGVIGGIRRGPLRGLFDSTQILTGVSGAGNNWASGHLHYGVTYTDKIVDQVRRAAEDCDSLQSFFLLHSTGGGTGSGLGTKVLGLLKDEFPEACRIVVPVFPSAEDDDVVVSPYNSLLAARELTEHADCVALVGNRSLLDILNVGAKCHGAPAGVNLKRARKSPTGSERPFDAMNNIVADMLLDMTASARFEGSLNMDLSEIATNLVPFPRLHYLVPSVSPVVPSRGLDQLFGDAFAKGRQLIRADPKRGLHLACALMLRGDVRVSDLRRNIQRFKPLLRFAPWNPEGWKTSLCSAPPVDRSRSLLALANTTGVKSTFADLSARFANLYRKKAYLHHYLQVQGMEQSFFAEALSSLRSLIEEYRRLDADAAELTPAAARLNVAR